MREKNTEKPSKNSQNCGQQYFNETDFSYLFSYNSKNVAKNIKFALYIINMILLDWPNFKHIVNLLDYKFYFENTTLLRIFRSVLT